MHFDRGNERWFGFRLCPLARRLRRNVERDNHGLVQYFISLRGHEFDHDGANPAFPVHYDPVNTGLRFSMKARRPSA